MKPKKSLNNTTVVAFALMALCDNPIHGNLLILHLDMDDITFACMKVIGMKYYYTYVKHSHVLEPPRGHAMVVEDLGKAFNMALVSHD